MDAICIATPLLSLLTYISKSSFNMDAYKGKTVFRMFEASESFGKEIIMNGNSPEKNGVYQRFS